MPQTSPPPVMVMGDSLGQGCRNLSVTALNCSQCYASVIATEMGWPLRVPKYPQPVLFDLLEVVSEMDIDLPVIVPDLLSKIHDNIQFWASSHWMQPAGTVHDNIAITGAVYEDIFVNTAQDYRTCIQKLSTVPVVELFKSSTVGQRLTDLHLAITGMFALNPEGDNATNPNAWSKTAFDIIKDRRPQNLFVDIGHNDTDSHFFSSGSDAIPLRHPGPDFGFDPDLYVSKMKQVITYLATLNAGGGSPVTIYLSVLPKISAVAALSPAGNFNNGYFDSYEPTLSTSKYVLSREQATALDQATKAANDAVSAFAAATDAAHIKIVDYYSLFSAIDYKNSSQQAIDAALQIVAGDYKIDNRYVQGREVYFPDPISSKPRGTWKWYFNQGGFQSIDGMHPSAVGYARVAVEILTQHMARALTPAQQTAHYNTAFAGDPLLSDFPAYFEAIISTLKTIRRAEGSSEQISGNDVPIATAMQILNSVHSSVSADFVRTVARQSPTASSQ